MKNLILFTLSCLALNGFSQRDKQWSLGLQWGFQGNHASLSGGMENANARFHQNPYGGGALHFIARYDHNKHWMAMSGLGFNSFGYEFALSENYSLKRSDKHFSTLKSEFSSVEIPTLVYYKFDPNCKNSKWLLGAGFVHTFIDAQSTSKAAFYDTEGNTNGNYIKSEASTKGGLTCMLRFAVGRERVFKRGNILNASMVFNLGLKEISTATVLYRIDGQEYQHEFTNRGNFVGFKLAYFFRPFAAKK
jgi:hypothetical protein